MISKKAGRLGFIKLISLLLVFLFVINEYSLSGYSSVYAAGISEDDYQEVTAKYTDSYTKVTESATIKYSDKFFNMKSTSIQPELVKTSMLASANVYHLS